MLEISASRLGSNIKQQLQLHKAGASFIFLARPSVHCWTIQEFTESNNKKRDKSQVCKIRDASSDQSICGRSDNQEKKSTRGS